MKYENTKQDFKFNKNILVTAINNYAVASDIPITRNPDKTAWLNDISGNGDTTDGFIYYNRDGGEKTWFIRSWPCVPKPSLIITNKGKICAVVPPVPAPTSKILILRFFGQVLTKFSITALICVFIHFALGLA